MIVSILQIRKLRHGEFKECLKDAQSELGRTRLWTQVCLSDSKIHVLSPLPGSFFGIHTSTMFQTILWQLQRRPGTEAIGKGTCAPFAHRVLNSSEFSWCLLLISPPLILWSEGGLLGKLNKDLWPSCRAKHTYQAPHSVTCFPGKPLPECNLWTWEATEDVFPPNVQRWQMTVHAHRRVWWHTGTHQGGGETARQGQDEIVHLCHLMGSWDGKKTGGRSLPA